MKNLSGLISLLSILLIVIGCASISKEDCLLTDWYEIGRLDGRQGKHRTAFQGRAKACLEHGINADRHWLMKFVKYDPMPSWYTTTALPLTGP